MHGMAPTPKIFLAQNTNSAKVVKFWFRYIITLLPPNINIYVFIRSADEIKLKDKKVSSYSRLGKEAMDLNELPME